jgi:hypothetical protein
MTIRGMPSSKRKEDMAKGIRPNPLVSVHHQGKKGAQKVSVAYYPHLERVFSGDTR